ncbi:MAG: AAA-like domain-containing protein [Cyanobacteria bacterium P01_E01_bin.42]
MNQMSNYYYVDTGTGALPREHPSYVERNADRELQEGIERASKDTYRVFYVLAPRQTGKSSLMRKTSDVLVECNICIEVNLHRMAGDDNSETIFYRTLLNRISKEIDEQIPILDCNEAFKNFWDRSKNQDSPREKFVTFLEQKLLPSLKKRLVIFLDEIQELVSQNLQNGFTVLMKSISENERLGNLVIILLGVAQPADLSTDTNLILNTSKLIELTYFDKKNCIPLLPGLQEISNNADMVLSYILEWTEGHPFLTQVVCNQVAQKLQEKPEKPNRQRRTIDRIVDKEIIKVWRYKDPQYHFSLIDRWFTRFPQNPQERDKRLQTLLEYKKILEAKQPLLFNAAKNPEQINYRLTLMSLGIVRKVNQYLKVANSIYRQIFDLDWIDETTQVIQEDVMDYSEKIYNRSVFMLIDASASMKEKDAETEDMERFDYIRETIVGDARAILDLASDSGAKICDTITGYFFNVPRFKEEFKFELYPQSSKQGIKRAFKEIRPQGGTAINNTLEAVIQQCLDDKRRHGKDAFIIIYTDGEFSNSKKFEELICSTCQQLENQDDIKIIILGYGSDILEKPTLEFYLDIDFNNRSHPNKNGEPCNIFEFDLGNERPEDILELLDRQLRADPNRKNAVPDWVNKYIPEWKEKAKQKGWLT